MDHATVAVYDERAAEYAARRPPKHRARARAFAKACLPGLPVVDLGTGPGAYLPDLPRPAVALDASTAMLRLATGVAPDVPAVRADLESPPFRPGSLGGAWARNAYLHVERERLPLALAHLHRSLAVGAPLALSVVTGDGPVTFDDDDFPGRRFLGWRAPDLAAVVHGAGFTDVTARIPRGTTDTWAWGVRDRTLPDHVGPGLRVLVCGLNPSVIAADRGVGYATPTNRFWPCALEAGLVTKDRDPFHALTHDGVGFTDLVKRATPNASTLTPDEYRAGAHRVERLVAWLQPRLVLFVGLTGWRAAVDAKATPGLQPSTFGGAPAYVMPSTSGLNAHVTRAALVDHLRSALCLAS